eukprot:CAMPEP_0206454234 /NCGR_PEP_ID=MMETSP0324_2-20121206/21016_1 /ASSEMBLY_ACC=CAM_ASM_000836 /TAXON_ID=2866 /ORGANISM="Crypthecodinium cohnii, Strain Seligo" /LENGTH=137 /DNA_ID=CAMNT_0053924669 /DNA_START=37 /DNA_END=446 /DNA_ORIENTATION=+
MEAFAPWQRQDDKSGLVAGVASVAMRDPRHVLFYMTCRRSSDVRPTPLASETCFFFNTPALLSNGIVLRCAVVLLPKVALPYLFLLLLHVACRSFSRLRDATFTVGIESFGLAAVNEHHKSPVDFGDLWYVSVCVCA